MVQELTEQRDASLVRAFLAIPLNTAILKTISSTQRELDSGLPGIRWVRPHNLHLTLLFFGNISEEFLENAAKIMVSVGSLFDPFPVTLTKIGAFPSTDRARVIWIEVQSSVLRELHHTLQENFHAAGFPIERRTFRPHITIGRCRKQSRRILSLQQSKVSGTMRVERLVLFESRLRSAGPEHLPRHAIRLADPK